MEATIQPDAPYGRLGLLRGAPEWVALGTAGSILLTVCGARLGGGTVTWWFHPRVLSGAGTRIVFYAAIAVLVVAWLGLGRVLRRRRVAPAALWPVALLWCLPLALGAPIFSRDVYSYLAQGTIAHLGLSPYGHAPGVLAHLGRAHVLGAVDPFWRSATAPYGPLFLGVTSVLVSLTGSHLIAGVLVIRAIELLGLVLLAVFVPRLARAAGADPARALWLTLISPLVLLQLVAPGHNDLLMIGAMVAGVTLALERRPLWGVGLCALAATIKLPAIAAVLFVAFAWARSEPGWRARIARSAQAVAVALAVTAAVTVVTGFGIDWVSSTLFSTPARVRLAITPATDLSWTAASLLRDIGAAVTFRGVESALRVAAFVASALVVIGLLLRTRLQTLPTCLGLALLALALGGPAAWPWYLCWGLVMLAAWPRAQESRALVVTVVAASLVVKPNGILALPIASSPVLAALWICVAALAWYAWGRDTERRPRDAELSDGLAAAHSILVEH